MRISDRCRYPRPSERISMWVFFGISGIGALETCRSFTNQTRGGSLMAKRHRIWSFLICITLVTAFLGCASTPTRESSGQYVDDSAITTREKAAIFDDPSLKVLQINV